MKLLRDSLSIKDLDINEILSLEKIILFHGSYQERIDSILSNGLRPFLMNKEGHNWDNEYDIFGFFTPRLDCVYFAEFEEAKEYSLYLVDNKSAKGGIVVEAELDTARLIADEDSYVNTWYQSIIQRRTCAHQGIVRPDRIRRIYNLEDDIIYAP